MRAARWITVACIAAIGTFFLSWWLLGDLFDWSQESALGVAALVASLVLFVAGPMILQGHNDRSQTVKTPVPGGVTASGPISDQERPGQPTPPPTPSGQIVDAGSSPFQLPRDIEDFTGRDEVVGLIEGLLRTRQKDLGTVVVAAIDGIGGVGKTTVALHVAHRLRDAFSDGQLYVNLRGAEHESLSPSEVLGQFLLALGVDREALPEDLEERARKFRMEVADRRILVVLDNARDEGQVRPLLPGSASCGAIVTSRSKLAGLGGVRRVDLGVLTPEEAAELLRKIVGPDRTDREPEAIRQLAYLCGYLPLAVRIAGAKLVNKLHWRVADLVRRLSNERRRLSEFKLGDLAVRASFALSYEELPEPEQQAFRLLGMVQGPDFPSWVVAALMDLELEEGVDLLEGLFDAQLVQAHASSSDGRGPRYRLHDLLRDFARELHAENDPPTLGREALARMLSGYLDLARVGFSVLRPGDPPEFPEGYRGSWRTPQALIDEVRESTFDWFTEERPSLLIGIRQAAETKAGSMAWELALAIRPFLNWQSQWSDWESSHRTALVAAEQAGDVRGQAMVLRHLGHAYEEQDRWDNALECFEKSLDLFNRTTDVVGAGFAMWSTGFALQAKGFLDEAERRFNECLTIFRTHGVIQWQALALDGLGLVYRDKGLFEPAESALRAALSLFESMGDRHFQARVQRDLGDVLLDRGIPEAALESFEWAGRVFTTFGDHHRSAVCTRDVGRVRLALLQLDEAEACFELALPMLEEVGNSHQVAITLHCLGILAGKRGAPTAALARFDEALPTLAESNDRRWQVRNHVAMAEIYGAQGRRDAALASLGHAISAAAGMGNEASVAQLSAIREAIATSAG